MEEYDYGRVHDAFSSNFINVFNEVRKICPCNLKTVFHYTTLNGFSGIFSSKKLWATNSRFLNDAREFSQNRDLAVAALSALCNKKSSRRDRNALQHGLDILKNVLGKSFFSTRAYVTCFCPDGDILSQWRGYAARGVGISIGFDVAELGRKDGFEFLPVCYKPDLLQGILELYFDGMVEAYSRLFDSNHHKQLNDDLTKHVISHLATIGAFFKDPGFEEEREVRLLAPTHMEWDGLSFFVRGDILVPYVEVSLEDNFSTLIKKIIIGPTGNFDVVMASMQEFLISRRVNHKIITRSSIPYRSFE